MPATDPRQALPSVDRLLGHPQVAAAGAGWSRRAALAVVRREIDRARRRIAEGEAAPSADEIAARCAVELKKLDRRGPRHVINATGVVVHTNLGRAPLSLDVVTYAVDRAANYSDLEFDLERGARGSRHKHVADLFELLFPGMGALVVNNNAAAVLLVLNTLALGREVVVSRGELVEIGGSFRVPDVLERSGARLVEVGTTNRTHLSDYREAIVGATAAILKVWPSNYRIVGFTAEAPLVDLVALARQRSLPLVVDQGCGRLFRDGPGPASEESVEELLDAGASVVCFSGDKLLGGPQCGVIVGDVELVRRCAANPLNRALRPGKLTLGTLAGTLQRWLREDPAAELPVPGMLSRSAEELRAAARALASRIRKARPDLCVEVRPGVSRVGGGAAPEEDLPTFVVAVTSESVSDEQLLCLLRAADPPVVARVEDGAVIFDPRTLLRGEDRELVKVLAATTTQGDEHAD